MRIKRLSALKIIGTFAKVLKKEGLLLFKSNFKDNKFILNVKFFYHYNFRTKWEIDFINLTAKGFQVKLKGVSNFKQAAYFVGEDFALPEEEIGDASLDLLYDMDVVDDSGVLLGAVVSFAETPAYALLEIADSNGNSFMTPLSKEFVELRQGKIVLKKLPRA